MSEELKPCKCSHCKGAVLVWHDDMFRILCECGIAENDFYYRREDAINAWNTRHGEQQPAGKL